MVYRLIVILFFGGMVGVCVQAAVKDGKKIDDLFDAIETKDTQAFKLLLAAGIDINKANEKSGDTPLMLAARHGYKEGLNTLLANKKINIDEKHKATGNTALMIAILECQNRTFAEQLINAKANPNVQNKDNETALLYAVRGRSIKDIDMLIKAGAMVDVASLWPRRCRGETVLTCAVKMGDMSIVKMLLQSKPAPSIDLEGPRDGTPLKCAINFNDLSAVQLLLQYGADFNRPDQSGSTPLMVAVSVGNSEIVRALLYAGADVSKQDNNGKTAFDLAEGKDSILSLLQQAQDKSLFLKLSQEREGCLAGSVDLDSAAKVHSPLAISDPSILNQNLLSSWSFPIPGVAASVAVATLLAAAALYVWHHKYSQV